MLHHRSHLLRLTWPLLVACWEPRHSPHAAARQSPAPAELSAARPAAEIPRGTPYVPPQCYTKTRDAAGHTHNPCFTCHVDNRPPNYIFDGSLQLSYAFGPRSRINPWTNLFVDRTAQIAAIPDDAIRAYVDIDNYAGLATRVVSAAWDSDGDGKWSGFVPDVAFHFDDAGFDRTVDDRFTGWRAYGYYPLPGTFWPTNGSFGDALIRLPAPFREDAAGRFDVQVYTINLAILEAVIARRDVPIAVTDETRLSTDLDGDGREGRASIVKYRFRPGGGGMSYVGRAGALQAQASIHLLPGLFPVGTEFVHSVRYLDARGNTVRMAQRMKELRYMVKTSFMSYGALEAQATAEAAEKASSPHKLRVMLGSSEHGISNQAGWRLQGFIEDARGELRPQTVPEHAYCIGCHSGVGVTDDSVFSFGRKLSGQNFQRGWFHWTQHALEGIAEPRRADGQGEYSFYLEQNGAGDELRANPEVLSRFFDASGRLRIDMATRIHQDVSLLLLPSVERALALDKAYRLIVLEQSFDRGRDATLIPATNVHRELTELTLKTGIATQAIDRRRTASR